MGLPDPFAGSFLSIQQLFTDPWEPIIPILFAGQVHCLGGIVMTIKEMATRSTGIRLSLGEQIGKALSEIFIIISACIVEARNRASRAWECGSPELIM